MRDANPKSMSIHLPIATIIPFHAQINNDELWSETFSSLLIFELVASPFTTENGIEWTSVKYPVLKFQRLKF
jgi:hypothetical protein